MLDDAQTFLILLADFILIRLNTLLANTISPEVGVVLFMS